MIDQFASYAGHQFALSAKQDDGATLREHLEAVAERTGILPPMLANGPALPAGCLDLWGVFLSLRSRRGGAGFGPARITFLEMDAYQRVTSRRLAPWEVDAVMRADDAVMRADDEFITSLPKPKEGKDAR